MRGSKARTHPPIVGIAPTRVHDERGKPLLGLRPAYLDALGAAGALPVILGGSDPAAAEAHLAGLDALVLPGGADIHPELYGEQPGPGLELLDDDLGLFYVALARAALASGLPALGICLGLQVMNVALEGTLIQDLPESAVAHRGSNGHDDHHPVAVEPGTRLHAAIGAEAPSVVSHHHQAVKQLGRGLRVAARAPDGVVEALEHEEAGYFLGVQWHPERSAGSEASRRLFADFIAVALERRAAGTRSG